MLDWFISFGPFRILWSGASARVENVKIARGFWLYIEKLYEELLRNMERVSEGEVKKRSILRDIGKIYFIPTRWTTEESTFYFIPNFFCFPTITDFLNFSSLRTQYNFSVSAAKNNFHIFYFHKIFICIFLFYFLLGLCPVYPVRCKLLDVKHYV